MELFITKLFEQPALYFSTVVAFAGSICVHEYSHALVADHLGDRTAKEKGFKTLNPLKVMGWMSIASLLILGFSWGAVPVKKEDTNRLRRAAISLAGPISNLLLLGVFALLLKWSYTTVPTVAVGTLAYYCRIFLLCALYANAILFLLNILPIPALDGWGAINPFLPRALIPTEKTKNFLFYFFIYVICFSRASVLFDMALESFASRFLPRQVSAVSLVSEGEMFHENGDDSAAYKAFQEAAEQGSPEGKLQLAVCLAEGYGCEPNPDKAFSLFSENSVRAYPLAKFYIGLMKINGIGCSQDYEEAYEMLSQQEVQQLFPLARAHLGFLLAEGYGADQDLRRAYELLNDEEVLKSLPLARFYFAVFLMEGNVCERDERRAFSLVNNEEVLEIPQAKYILGSWYYAGAGTEQDFAKAAKYLKAAADAGEPNAMQFLGYQNGVLPDYGMKLEELLRRCWNESK